MQESDKAESCLDSRVEVELERGPREAGRGAKGPVQGGIDD